MSGAHGHGHVEGENKKIALLIAVLALFLALAETMAKGAQTSGLSYNVEASNLWAFFQAKDRPSDGCPHGGRNGRLRTRPKPRPASRRRYREADRRLGQDGRALGVG